MNPELYKENPYINQKLYQNLKKVCKECPVDLNRILRDLYTLSPHLEEEKILSMIDQMTGFIIFEKDLPKDLTSRILYTTTCGVIPVLNEKVKKNGGLEKTKDLLKNKYWSIVENLDSIQKNSDDYEADDCQFGKAVLTTFLGVSNPVLPRSARFLEENLL